MPASTRDCRTRITGECFFVSWENILSARVAEYVSGNLYMQLLYDREVAAAGRLKQTLSMGLTYKFI